DLVLVDLDAQALHRLVPVEIDQSRILVLTDGLRDKKRSVASPLWRLAADPVLQGPADRRPQLERGDSSVGIGELFGKGLLEACADDLTLFYPLGDDDCFGKIVVA